MCLARHVQVTQNNKFAISLQYLKKEVSDEVDFLRADNHESLIKIDTMILDGWPSIPEVSKIPSLQCLYNISQKNLEMKLIFCIQIDMKVSYKLIATVCTSKFSTR